MSRVPIRNDAVIPNVFDVKKIWSEVWGDDEAQYLPLSTDQRDVDTFSVSRQSPDSAYVNFCALILDITVSHLWRANILCFPKEVKRRLSLAFQHCSENVESWPQSRRTRRLQMSKTVDN